MFVETVTFPAHAIHCTKHQRCKCSLFNFLNPFIVRVHLPIQICTNFHSYPSLQYSLWLDCGLIIQIASSLDLAKVSSYWLYTLFFIKVYKKTSKYIIYNLYPKKLNFIFITFVFFFKISKSFGCFSFWSTSFGVGTILTYLIFPQSAKRIFKLSFIWKM